MSTEPEHIVHPSFIEPGDIVTYTCQFCGRWMKHTWQPTDAVTTFANPSCRMHGTLQPPPLMLIADVHRDGRSLLTGEGVKD